MIKRGVGSRGRAVVLSMIVRGPAGDRAEPGWAVRRRIPAGMGELQADKQVVVAANQLAMGLAGRSQQPLEGGGVGRIDQELARIGPSSGTTAQASPQISLAPPAPKR